MGTSSTTFASRAVILFLMSTLFFFLEARLYEDDSDNENDNVDDVN